MSITTPVHNRGVAPESFIKTLVAWAAKAPEEIFEPLYRGKEPDIYEAFSIYKIKNPTHDFPTMRDEHSLYRRAVMCEVLRVLAGFESSWRQREGRDVTNPSSNTAATEEAGWFQCSANSVNFHSSLKNLFNEWALCSMKNNWKDMNASGKTFIEMTKGIPVYAIEHCARLLRFTIRHHGPLVRGEVFTYMNGDAIREFIELLEQANPSLSVEQPEDQAPDNTLTNTDNPMTTKRYIIDPGHGGTDPGAMSVGIKESTITLAVSSKLRDLINKDERFLKAHMTRDTDTFVTLDGRAKMANDMDAILVSIHTNASNGKGTGFEGFTSPGKSKSDELATELLEAYHEEMGDLLPGRYDTRDGDPDKEAKFTVLTKTKGPAVLFELGFIDNLNDRKLLVDEGMQHRMARALYTGICGFEGLVPMDLLVPPPVVPDPRPVAPPLAPLQIPVTSMDPRVPDDQDPVHFEVCAKWFASGAASLMDQIIESRMPDGDSDLFGWEDFELVGILERAAQMLELRAETLTK